MRAARDMQSAERRRLQGVARARVVAPVLRAIELDPRAVALDLGCGRGSWTLELALRGHRVVAVDRRAEALEWVRQEAKRSSLPVERVAADFATQRFGRRFDLVIQIFTGVTAAEHLARLVSKNGIVLWRETHDAYDTAFADFEVVRSFRGSRGLRLLRRCSTSRQMEPLDGSLRAPLQRPLFRERANEGPCVDVHREQRQPA
jgi:SAM-dependent methyltransferase